MAITNPNASLRLPRREIGEGHTRLLVNRLQEFLWQQFRWKICISGSGAEELMLRSYLCYYQFNQLLSDAFENIDLRVQVLLTLACPLDPCIACLV